MMRNGHLYSTPCTGFGAVFRSIVTFLLRLHSSVMRWELDRQMILCHNAKVMKNELLLSQYLPDGMGSAPILVHASHALNGGCFLVSFSVLLMIVGAVAMSFCTCGVSLIFVPLLAPLLFILPLFCL
jgi:hypothetical protein